MARVSSLLAPLQIAPAPDIVLTVESGFTVTLTTSVSSEQAPLITLALYQVFTVKLPEFRIVAVSPETTVQSGVALVALI